MKYLNLKTNYGVETIDELNPKDFNSYKEFRTELKRLVNEYRISGMSVYTSQRADKTWNA
jgi:hypothetical protein